MQKNCVNHKHTKTHTHMYNVHTNTLIQTSSYYQCFSLFSRGLAVDMLEDFSLDIFCIMLKTFAFIQCTKIGSRCLGNDLLAYENSFISGIQKVSARKLEILKQMNFNAYVDKDSKEYEQCVSLCINRNNDTFPMLPFHHFLTLTPVFGHKPMQFAVEICMLNFCNILHFLQQKPIPLRAQHQ